MADDFSAAEQDLVIDSGDDETVEITRQDSDGNAIDITNYEFWLTAKAAKDDRDSEAKFQKHVTTHTDPSNGVTEIDISTGDTENLNGSFYYDIQEKTGGNAINTLVEGKLLIRKDVTESVS